MKPLDNLFKLVHSLTPSEKRYFKIYASRHTQGEKNNYEKLFDAIERMPENKPYDEALLKEQLKGKNFGSNLAVEKKNLYKLLLSAMRSFHSGRTPENKLLESFGDLRFLYDKGLHDDAQKELEKAFEFARETENLPAQIFLYNLKQRLTRFTQTEKGVKESEKDFAEEKEALSLLNAERSSVHLRRRIYNLYISQKLKPFIVELKKEIEEIVGSTKSLAITFLTKSSLLAAQAIIAETEGSYAKAMKLYEEMIELWEKNPLKLHEPNAYIRGILGNYLVCAHNCERFDVFPITIEKIEKIPSESITEEADTFRIAKQLRLTYLLNSNGQAGATELVEEVELGLEKYASFISLKISVNFRMNICLLLLQERRFSELIVAVSQTYTLIGNDKAFEHFMIHLKFIEIMAHISLKNYELTGYLITNTERWLREHEMNNEFTSLLLKWFKKIGKGDKYNGQLAGANCPPSMLMLQEIVKRWLSGK